MATPATNDHAQGQGLALRQTPLPTFLRDLGVQIVADETINARIVVIPREVRQKVNVIDPVTSLVQADPNWTPRISMVELEPSANGPHFYEQAGRKLAPTKQALEILAKAAGILYTRTSRIARAELAEGERYGYTATLGIRRSDGTVEQITRDKTWVEEAERAEIEDAVSRAVTWENNRRTDKPKFVADSPEWHAEVKKRWLKELKDAPAKTESKAVLRAIRAALQIPHTFSPEDAAKPFFVVGVNFSPDYSDVEVRRALVAIGLNAEAAVYGGARELTPAAAPADVEVDSAPSGGDGRQVEGAAVEQAFRDEAASSAPDEKEPAAEAVATGEFQIPTEATEAQQLQAAADASGAVAVANGKYGPQGKKLTIAEAAQVSEAWLKLVLGAPEHPNHEDAKRYAYIYAPEIFHGAMAASETGQS